MSGNKKPIYNHYEELVNRDVIGLLIELFRKYGYKLRQTDAKIHAELTQTVDTPWVHIRPAIKSDGKPFDCYRWHKIMFDVCSSKLGEGAWVPSQCQECWKVVFRPRYITQLFQLEHVQRELNLPSKCGLELRDYVHGNYGGYWYNESLEEGIGCYNRVYDAIKEDRLLSKLLDDVDNEGKTKRLLLKRACTEFEKLCGPSDKWEVTKEQLHVEALVNRYVVADDLIRDQAAHVQTYVRRKWIEHAYTVGDPTVFKLTGQKPIYKPYVTYHPARGVTT